MAPNTWALFGVATLSSLVLYVRTKAVRRPILELLPHLFPGLSCSLVPAIEAVLVSAIAGYLAILVVEPVSYAQAVWAGLGWTSLLGLVRD